MHYTVSFTSKKTAEPLRIEVKASGVREAADAALEVLNVAGCAEDYFLDFCVKSWVLKYFDLTAKRKINAK